MLIITRDCSENNVLVTYQYGRYNRFVLRYQNVLGEQQSGNAGEFKHKAITHVLIYLHRILK